MKKKSSPKKQPIISFQPIILMIIALILLSILFFQIFLSSNKNNLPVKSSSNNNPLNILAKPSIATNTKTSNFNTNIINLTPIPVKKKEVLLYNPQVSGYQIRVPILMYHYIGNNPNPTDLQRDNLSVSPEKFEEQMKYLSDNGYSVISLDTLYAALRKQVTLSNKPVVLTFDDGYVDFFVNAYPILRRYNLHATAFIPTGLMGQGYYLQWSQIKEMSSSGLISFGGHTIHHYSLPSVSPNIALEELVESKRILQEQLGIPINFMAYPYGFTSESVIELTKKAGYLGSVGTWAGKIQSEGTIYNMPRLRVGGSYDLRKFIELL